MDPKPQACFEDSCLPCTLFTLVVPSEALDSPIISPRACLGINPPFLKPCVAVGESITRAERSDADFPNPFSANASRLSYAHFSSKSRILSASSSEYPADFRSDLMLAHRNKLPA